MATLFGSRTIGYKLAITWATLATCLGSVVSVFLAMTLVKNFSGKGLLPDAIAAADDFHVAVAAGAGLTLSLATLTGFPISTTHGLTGALLGAGLVAIGWKVNFVALGMTFVLPLLLSPVVAAIATSLLYLMAHQARQRLRITTESCVCVGEMVQTAFASAIPVVTAPAITTLPSITIDRTQNCQQRYMGSFLGISVQHLVDGSHFVSAGIVSFARGLNDTPKIVGLMLGLKALSLQGSAIAVGMAIAIGGLLNARRVAETMSQKITTMNAGQGLSANLITGILVILASRFGVPVSTTHVSVGAIYGVGVVSKQANNQVFSQILLSWVLTLPIAAGISAIVYKCLHWAG